MLAAPAGADEPAALAPRAKGDLAIGARAVLRKYCAECHGAPPTHGGVNVVDHARLVAKAPNPIPFVSPGDDRGSQVIQFIEDGSMPPGGRPRPTAEELAILKSWVKASAPGYPAAFDDRTTLELMLADLERRPDDAPFLRYLSFAHLVRDDAPPPDLRSREASLLDALRWCGIRTMPQPVDDAATLYRLDTRQAGWDHRELFSQRKGTKDDICPLTPYDLILLEYPHGSALTPGHPLAGRLNGYFRDARTVRPVAYLQADWVADRLRKGAPLADDLRSLSELAEALSRQGNPSLGGERKMPCGTTSRPFRGENPVPPAEKPAAWNPVLPLAAWYAGDTRADPPPFTLEAAAIDEAGKPLKAVATRTPFKLKVTCDRNVNFVLLVVLADGSVVVQPTNLGGFLTAGEAVITPRDAKDFKIASILTGEPTATEYFVLLASQGELPAPEVARSRHAVTQECDENKRFPVYRFLYDAEAKLDPARVIRKVIPVTLTKPK